MSIRENYQRPLHEDYPTSELVLWSRNLAAIKKIKQLQASGQPPTEADLHVLSRYAGYGNCSAIFENPKNRQPYDNLVEATSDAEFAGVMRSIPYAYYTPPMIARAMWDAVASMGFAGGRVLDPATGTGNFLAVIPEDIAADVEMVGVENDLVPASIAEVLLPQACILPMGYQDVRPKDHLAFDLVITNVPFGQDPIYDKDLSTGDDRMTLQRVHDFYLAKSLKMVRAGGIVAIITTRYFMDSKDDKIRRYVHERARLIGGVRLPEHSFGATPVVADILFFQKRLPDETCNGEEDPEWLGLVEYSMDGLVKSTDGHVYASRYNKVNHLLNRYMAANSIGDYRERSGQYGPVPTLVLPSSADLIAELTQRLRSLPSKVYAGEIFTCASCGRETRVGNHCAACKRDIAGNSFADSIPELTHIIGDDGVIWQKVDGEAIRVSKPRKTLERLRDQLGLIDRLNNVNEADDDLALRAGVRHLAISYSRFRAQHGPLNSRANRIAIGDDPRAPFLQSIEMWDEETQVATPSAIFRRTAFLRGTWPEVADNARQAVGISLARYNHIQWGYVASLCGKSVQQVIDLLEGEVFLDPVNGWQTSEAYLSGDVVTKLDEARSAAAAATVKGIYDINIAALTAVQPTKLTAAEIWPGLGAPWIPREIIRQFANEMLDADSPMNTEKPAPSSYQPPTGYVSVSQARGIGGAWTVSWDSYHGGSRRMATDRWGTSKTDAAELLQHLLNGTRITIYTVDGKGNRTPDKVETTIAREKAKQIQTAFEKWFWADDDRRASMEALYNERMNRWVPRQYSGDHLELPGMNPEIKLRPHQKNAVWRGLQGGNQILWHRVGAGKTFTMIAMSMEMRRLGLATRPMHVVPDHLLAQYALEFWRLYPHAKLLQVASSTLSPKNRARYLAYITSANFDAVIITHSAFKLIKVRPATWQDFITREIEQLGLALSDTDKDDRTSRRNIERAKLRLEAKLDEIVHKADKGSTAVYWESLGIDALFYDEAHHARNLHYATRRAGVSGIGGSESGMAFDLFVKTQYMLRRCVCGRPLGVGNECGCVRNQRARGGKLVLSTGTLLTNTIAELFTFFRFTMYDELSKLGFADFDSWAAQFGEIQTMIEMSPSGKGFRQYERFIRFRNVPELQMMLSQVCDAQLDADAMGLELPKIKTGEPVIIECEPDEAQLGIFQDCANRYNDLMAGRVGWDEDNVLAIMGAAGRAAIDARLVNPQAKPNKNGKIEMLVRNVLAIHKDGRGVGIDGNRSNLVQHIFLDTYGGSSGNVNLYNEIVNKLHKGGVPRTEIAIAQEHKTPAKKQVLQDRVNSGDITVIIGSTRAMGEGWNIQRLAVAQHQIDTPWTPTGVEQREGRIRRQGNLNPEIAIYRYVTPDSLDFYRWHLLSAKLGFIKQIATPNTTSRMVEDIDQTILSFEQMKAVAAGNALVLEQVSLMTRLQTVKMLRGKWARAREQARLTVENAPLMLGDNARKRETLESMQQIVSRKIMPRLNGEFDVWVQGERFGNEVEARRALQRLISQARPVNNFLTVGGIGFDLAFNEMEPFCSTIVEGRRMSTALAYRADTSWSRFVDWLHYYTGQAVQDNQYHRTRLLRNISECEEVLSVPFSHQEEQDDLEARLLKIETILELEAQSNGG